jgi:hypothetical protein
MIRRAVSKRVGLSLPGGGRLGGVFIPHRSAGIRNRPLS